MKKTRKYLLILFMFACTIFGMFAIPKNAAAFKDSSINTVNITIPLPVDGQNDGYISFDDIIYESDPEEQISYCGIESFYHNFDGSLMGMSVVETFEEGEPYCVKIEVYSSEEFPFVSSTCIYVNEVKCDFDIVDEGGGAVAKYYFTCPSSEKTEPQVSDFDFTAPTNSTYDNSGKVPTLTPKTSVTGMGQVTLMYATSLDSDEWMVTDPVNAGTYYVKASIAENSLYSEKELTDENWKFTIDPTVFSISWDTTSFEYDGTAKIPGGTYEILSNDEVTVTISGEAINAGIHKATVSLSGTDAGNYTLGDNNEVEFTILQKAITVTGTIADSKYFDGTDEAVMHLGETSGIIEGDDVTITPIGKFSSVDVENEIEVIITYELTGEKASNYTVADDTTIADIEQKAITVTADDISIIYGDKDPELTATVDGLVGTDTVEYTISRTAGEDAGAYTITVQGEASQGNYSITFIAGTFTINPKNDADVKTSVDDLAKIQKEYQDKNPGKDTIVQMSISKNANVDNIALIQAKAGTKKLTSFELNLIVIVGGDAVEDAGNTNTTLVTTTYSFDFTKKSDIQVFRLHDTNVDELTETANSNGEYVIIDSENGTITVVASKYSTYSFAYNEVTSDDEQKDSNPKEDNQDTSDTTDTKEPVKQNNTRVTVLWIILGIDLVGLIAVAFIIFKEKIFKK